ncbi:MAG: NAD(P)/FAD-dependent oxidoreductase [Candidatus Limnocylindrales bacterium]
MPDAIVVGSGPNGLAAAITLARAGLSVTALEAAATPGGGARSAELTLPGYVHDVCSSIMSLARLSPFLASIDWTKHGVAFIRPDVPVAQAFTPDRGVLLERSIEATAEGLGRDGAAWRRLMGPLVDDADELMPWLLGPTMRLTRHPIAQARFGLPALLSATRLGALWFRDEPARALLAGLSAHSMLSLRRPATAAFGLVLGMTAHADGWPVVAGGVGRLADGLAKEFRALGGTIEVGHEVRSLAELPVAKAVLLDVAPRHAASIAADQLPDGYRRALERFRYGAGVFKVDWALSGPIPWRDPALGRAGTVHLGGSIDEVALSESEVEHGRIAERPFVLLVQASICDPSRAPADGQTAWAYCHVPPGSTVDMTERMEAQIERYAPGFRELVLGRTTHDTVALEAYNANYVGGDINAGKQDLRQQFARPVMARDPYAMPASGLYLCSSSTPPGGGVHGMSGYLAAKSALKREFKISI